MFRIIPKSKYFLNHLKFRVIGDINFKPRKTSSFSVKYCFQGKEGGKRNLFCITDIVLGNLHLKSNLFL